MKPSLWTLLAGSVLALALALAGGCGQAVSTPSLGGETHWLVKCGGDVASPCGPELECICGVCTRVCSDAADCAGVASGATCGSRQETPFAGACESQAPERVCAPSANTDVVDTRGQIEGMRYDSRGCFRASTVAGTSATRDTAYCPLVQTFARDPQGDCWRFVNGCIPDGFEPILEVDKPAHACTSVTDICIDSLACNDSHVATVAGCLSCSQAQGLLGLRWNETASYTTPCSSDLDCVLADTQLGCRYPCPFAIHRDDVAAHQRTVQRLDQSYCGDPKWSTLCSAPSPSCADIIPRCVAGQCSGPLAD